MLSKNALTALSWLGLLSCSTSSLSLRSTANIYCTPTECQLRAGDTNKPQEPVEQLPARHWRTGREVQRKVKPGHAGEGQGERSWFGLVLCARSLKEPERMRTSASQASQS